MFRLFRRIFLKIERKIFYYRFGFYPEDIKKLIYVQKYLEKNGRKNKSYNDYLKEYFHG